MKILVCIKPGASGQMIGPFEALALEAGLMLRQEAVKSGHADAWVDVITAGPVAWEEGVRRAFGLGADQGFHFLTQEDERSGGCVPASVRAQQIASAVLSLGKKRSYDLVLTGVISQDLMAGHTGPMLAEYLNFSLATAVVKLSFMEENISAVKEWEGGVRETLEIRLPALVTIQAGGYTPGYPKLSQMLKAKEKKVTRLNGQDFEDPIPKERFSGLALPESTREGKRIMGSLEDQVRAFHSFLRKRALL
ncbi:MAG: hypothetical protein HUK40_14165 [Desulfobacter sp.]|nr:hypothetical protein [Desulfobacter sp.]WDP87719.1 MAG: hypothetical protein HUN05_23430 [Desulfobacter sp.]